MTELNDRVRRCATILEELPNATSLEYILDGCLALGELIKDQQSRINELEAAIREHLEHPLMGSKELKEVLGK